MRKPSRPETEYLNQYQSGVIYKKHYLRRLESGNIVSDHMMKRLLYFEEIQEDIVETINQIENPRIRELFYDKCVNGLSYEEIGKKLGISPRTASRYYYKNLDKIKIKGGCL